MSNEADMAQRHEESEREAAVTRHRNRQQANQHKSGGRVLCLDCGEPIPSQRLAAHPFAVRCIEDARRYEMRRKHIAADRMSDRTTLLSPRRPQ